ncbi:MAG: LamG domain-containing protein, partial [Sphingobacteriales bacterium]
WYHLVGVFEDGLQRIYVNGSLRQSLSRSFNVLRECNDNMYVIGGFVNELPTRFNGVIDDLRIYNRALGEEEILSLAKDFKPID